MPETKRIKFRPKTVPVDVDKRRRNWKKIKGCDSELTRLKELWREPSFPQAYWRERFVSRCRQSTMRQEILKEFNIKLERDSQLTRFRQWVAAQDKREEIEEQLEEDCRRIEKMFPKATEDEVRRIVFKAYHLRALARDDLELGKFVLRQSLAERKFALTEKKAQKADRLDEEKALKLCLEKTREFPELQQQFRTAFAEYKKRKRRMKMPGA